MRRGVRALGTFVAIAGVGLLAWVLVVWQWQDPFTALYTKWKQHELAQQYDKLLTTYHPRAAKGSLAAIRRDLRIEARDFRHEAKIGQAIGRIKVPRMGVDMMLVNGTDEGSLIKGPGRDPRSGMPGEGRLVYIAGHRTTYLAPFAHIDAMRRGDHITLTMPYATLVYSVTGARVVLADDLSVLENRGHEELELQACHPRFFATHRYIVYAKLVSVKLRGAVGVSPTALAAAAQT
jgi:sortase A